MRLRKLLLATAAIVMTSTLALAPTASASTPGGPIARVSVGGNTSNGTHLSFLSMTAAQLQLNVYGVSTTSTCTYGSGTALVRGGTLGIPTYEATINILNLTCPSIFPGTTLTVSATCGIDVDLTDTNVHVGLVDSGGMPWSKFHPVAGTAKLTNAAGAECMEIYINNGCRFRVGNSSSVGFDEAINVNGSQDLVLSGNSPKVVSPNAACLGAVTNGQSLTLNAIFDVASPDGSIDIQN